MSPEDAFRRVLAARLPAGPGWTAWIDGTVQELVASAVVLTPEEADFVVSELHGMLEQYGNADDPDEQQANATRRALAARLEEAS